MHLMLCFLGVFVCLFTPSAADVSNSSPPGSQAPCPVTCSRGNCSDGVCICLKGWSGRSCDLPCALDCGDEGRCDAYRNGTTFCNCVHGYTSTPCRSDKVISTETTASAGRNSSSHRDQSTTTQIPTVTPLKDANENQVESTPTELPTLVNNNDSTRERETSMPTTTTPLSKTSRKSRCSAGIVCQHGVCKSDSVTCACDNGWVGFFCETPCTLDCGQFGQCFPISGRQICRCKPGYTDPSCNSTQSEPPELTTTTFASQTTPGSTESLRPLFERICSPKAVVFECKHGVCKTEKIEGGQLFQVKYVCVCDPGWIGLFCDTRCTLDCGQNGRCQKFQNGSLFCRCSNGYIGEACATLRPSVKPEVQTPSWHWWIVGACALLLLVLLFLLIFLPYYLWKKRFIFIMKVVYLFQPFEDEDDKQYDAFVSYKSTTLDEEFVLNTLYPKLEKSLHFRLCLHFRDFVPGETIANNIIDAMHKSRRTIMVLTPSYIQSEFCRFEYQKAQHEMLKRKQRLIPIVLQDISGEREFMDETLRSILDTVTYIEWPVEQSDRLVGKFWKRLELSMPKKRQSASQHHEEVLSPEFDTDTSYSGPISDTKNKPLVSSAQANGKPDSLSFCTDSCDVSAFQKSVIFDPGYTDNGVGLQDFESINLDSTSCAVTSSTSENTEKRTNSQLISMC